MKKDKIGNKCNTHGRKDKCIQTFGQERELEKKLFRRPRRRCKNNIEKDLKGIMWNIAYCIYLFQDRARYGCIVNITTYSIKGVKFLDDLSDYLILKEKCAL
jgi:hypothetical protein